MTVAPEEIPIEEVFERMGVYFLVRYGNHADRPVDQPRNYRCDPVHYQNLYMLRGERGDYVLGWGKANGQNLYNFAIKLLGSDLDQEIKELYSSPIESGPTLFYHKLDGTLLFNQRHEVGKKMRSLLASGAINYFTTKRVTVEISQGVQLKMRLYRHDIVDHLIHLIETSYGPYRPKSDPPPSSS